MRGLGGSFFIEDSLGALSYIGDMVLFAVGARSCAVLLGYGSL